VVTGKCFFMIAHVLYQFPGSGQRIAALGTFQQGPVNFIHLLDPQARDKTILQPSTGPEQIAACQPDLLLLRSPLARTWGPVLKALDIPVVYLDLETPEDYFRDLQILGELLGQPARAAELVSYYRSRVERVQQAVSGLEPADRPRVLLLRHSLKDGLAAFQVPPGHWMQTRLVEMAGGVPVWLEAGLGQGWSRVNLEQLAAWNPEVILVVSYFSDPSDLVRRLAADPTWQTLAAVRQSRVFAVPADVTSWDEPSPRWVLGLLWMAVTLHPDRLPGLDVMDEFRTFYTRLYRLDPALVQDRLQPILTGTLQ
jgi:iron complex transport system substrate-binding protein